MALGIVLLVALAGFAVGYGRKDVVLTVIGYAFVAFFITVALILGSFYLYTKLVIELWTRF